MTNVWYYVLLCAVSLTFPGTDISPGFDQMINDEVVYSLSTVIGTVSTDRIIEKMAFGTDGFIVLTDKTLGIFMVVETNKMERDLHDGLVCALISSVNSSSINLQGVN